MEIRQIASVRFSMGASSYQRYRAVTLAENVSQETVVHILERQPELTGHSNRNPAAVCGQPVFCSDYRIHRAHFQ